MSSIASCTIIPLAKIVQLRDLAVPKRTGFLFRKIKDYYYDFIKKEGTSLPDFDGVGFYCIMALAWLEEDNNIDLMKSEYNELASFLSKVRREPTFVLTKDLSDKFADVIRPNEYDNKKLTQYFREFNERDDPHAGQGMIAAITWLKNCLSRMESTSIGLLTIG